MDFPLLRGTEAFTPETTSIWQPYASNYHFNSQWRPDLSSQARGGSRVNAVGRNLSSADGIFPMDAGPNTGNALNVEGRQPRTQGKAASAAPATEMVF